MDSTTFKVNNHFKDLFNDHNTARFKIIYGGAGSGKSYSTAQKIVLDFLTKYGLNTLILRKVHRTNRISTFPLILKLLTGFEDRISINQSNMTITNLDNNNVIIFNGLDNSEKIKSITFKNGILNTIWIEEASECTREDVMQLSLRLRGESRWMFQIILTFNPISEHHWIKKHFFNSINTNYFIHHSTYLNNPYIDEEYKKQMIELKSIDINYYNIYALGQWGILNGKIFTNYKIETFDINTFDNYFIGLDFGTNDPTAIVLISKIENNIYICKTHKQVGLLNYQIDKILRDDFNYSTTIVADSQSANQINELKLLGNNIIPCTKGPDSIISGIKWLKQYNIIIHSSNSIDILNELDTYVWRKDKNDNSIDQPVDFNNHLIDALRYATQYYRNESSIKIEFTPVFSSGDRYDW